MIADSNDKYIKMKFNRAATEASLAGYIPICLELGKSVDKSELDSGNEYLVFYYSKDTKKVVSYSHIST